MTEAAHMVAPRSERQPDAIARASPLAMTVPTSMRVRPPLAAAIALISVFAIFHGYAHGRELPRRADALTYCVGFVTALGSLTGLDPEAVLRVSWVSCHS
jgi:hydrogenase/urease accessory protein HupE